MWYNVWVITFKAAGTSRIEVVRMQIVTRLWSDSSTRMSLLECDGCGVTDELICSGYNET
jgi:hypothetical protein